jgi:methyltransferase-like protein
MVDKPGSVTIFEGGSQILGQRSAPVSQENTTAQPTQPSGLETEQAPTKNIEINEAVNAELDKILAMDPVMQDALNDIKKAESTLDDLRDLANKGAIDKTLVDQTAEDLSNKLIEKVDTMAPGYKEAENGIYSLAQAADSFATLTSKPLPAMINYSPPNTRNFRIYYALPGQSHYVSKKLKAGK